MVFDIIVSWPKNCDYPLFRQMINKHRDIFNEVIVAFTGASGFDYSPFVRDQMFNDHVLFLDASYYKGDWRNYAVNMALLHSYNAPFVWFTEQDFIPRPGFFEFVKSCKNDGVIGVYQGDRLHPCCLFMDRVSLNKTNKDFSAKPPEYDHFGKVQIDLENAGIAPTPIPDDLYFHYNGLSHNWRLISEGEKPNYKPDEFYQYLTGVLASEMELHPNYFNVANNAIINR